MAAFIRTHTAIRPLSVGFGPRAASDPVRLGRLAARVRKLRADREFEARLQWFLGLARAAE